MANRGNKKPLVPGVEQALERFKTEIAGELGIFDGSPNSTLQSAMEKYKKIGICFLFSHTIS